MEGKKVICVLRALRTGGAERQLRGLALLLKERGYDVEVLTYHHGSFHESDLIDNGVRVIRIPKKGSSLKLARDLAAHFERENPNAVISCLSNATQLTRPEVCTALQRIENPILKLDAGNQEMLDIINGPIVPVNLDEVTAGLKYFNGNIIIQTKE